jgi:hypothetical protein
MLANATRLCEAKFGTLFMCEGDAFRVASMHNAPLAYVEARTRMPIVRARRDTALWRAANAKRAAQVSDITKEQGYLEGDPFVVDAATLGSGDCRTPTPRVTIDITRTFAARRRLPTDKPAFPAGRCTATTSRRAVRPGT